MGHPLSSSHSFILLALDEDATIFKKWFKKKKKEPTVLLCPPKEQVICEPEYTSVEWLKSLAHSDELGLLFSQGG